ncbi:hypothetical protein B0H14DRAFT_2600970 [Mycena olivaceomarginata]|nr:hypothetical protein B0H14DRAFT_2600970 [Mycena olivaceomarginata]
MANASQLEPAHTLPTAAIEEYHSIWFEHPTSGWTRGSPVRAFQGRILLSSPSTSLFSPKASMDVLIGWVIPLEFEPRFFNVVTCSYDMEENASRLASRGQPCEAVNNFTMVGNGKASNSFGPVYHWIAYRKELMQSRKGKLPCEGLAARFTKCKLSLIKYLHLYRARAQVKLKLEPAPRAGSTPLGVQVAASAGGASGEDARSSGERVRALLVGLVLRTRTERGVKERMGSTSWRTGMEGDAGMEVEVDTEETPRKTLVSNLLTHNFRRRRALGRGNLRRRRWCLELQLLELGRRLIQVLRDGRGRDLPEPEVYHVRDVFVISSEVAPRPGSTRPRNVGSSSLAKQCTWFRCSFARIQPVVNLGVHGSICTVRMRSRNGDGDGRAAATAEAAAGKTIRWTRAEGPAGYNEWVKREEGAATAWRRDGTRTRRRGTGGGRRGVGRDGTGGARLEGTAAAWGKDGTARGVEAAARRGRVWRRGRGKGAGAGDADAVVGREQRGNDVEGAQAGAGQPERQPAWGGWDGTGRAAAWRGIFSVRPRSGTACDARGART